MKVDRDYQERTLTVTIDESKIESVAAKEISKLLHCLHVYRCTADVKAAKEYYERLTEVDEEWLEVRKIVTEHMQKEPARIFVQANTILDESTGKVQVIEYEQSVEGVIQSWAERKL